MLANFMLDLPENLKLTYFAFSTKLCYSFATNLLISFDTLRNYAKNVRMRPYVLVISSAAFSMIFLGG